MENFLETKLKKVIYVFTKKNNILEGITNFTVRDFRSMWVSKEVNALTTYHEAAIIRRGLKEAEEFGIIYIDEIDKIVSNQKNAHHADASDEGVQRDLLPIIEGTSVI